MEQIVTYELPGDKDGFVIEVTFPTIGKQLVVFGNSLDPRTGKPMRNPTRSVLPMTRLLMENLALAKQLRPLYIPSLALYGALAFAFMPLLIALGTVMLFLLPSFMLWRLDKKIEEWNVYRQLLHHASRNEFEKAFELAFANAKK